MSQYIYFHTTISLEFKADFENNHDDIFEYFFVENHLFYEDMRKR